MIKEYTKENHINFLSQFLPDGKAYRAKYEKNSHFRTYLSAKSVEFKRLTDLFATFLEELDPNNTEIFISDWEKALQIPDGCIPLATSNQTRRDNIILKLTSLSVQTEEDFQTLGEKFGFTINFLSGNFPPYNVPFTPGSIFNVDNFPPYNVPFIPGSFPISKFTWAIIGDFDTNVFKAEIYQCLVRSLIPSGYKVFFFNS